MVSMCCSDYGAEWVESSYVHAPRAPLHQVSDVQQLRGKVVVAGQRNRLFLGEHVLILPALLPVSEFLDFTSFLDPSSTQQKPSNSNQQDNMADVRIHALWSSSFD